jgi:hypothetical protein
VSILWRKVLGDVRQGWRALSLIAVVLILGATGVVAALDARSILQRESDASYAGSVPPDIALWFQRVDDAVLQSVASNPNVAGVEPRRVVSARVQARDGSWLLLRLAILRDIDSLAVGRLHRHAEPLGRTGVWVEQSGEPLLAGKDLRVRTPTGAIATIPIAGYVHDASIAPSTQERMIYGYATRMPRCSRARMPSPTRSWRG